MKAAPSYSKAKRSLVLSVEVVDPLSGLAMNDHLPAMNRSQGCLRRSASSMVKSAGLFGRVFQKHRMSPYIVVPYLLHRKSKPNSFYGKRPHALAYHLKQQLRPCLPKETGHARCGHAADMPNKQDPTTSSRSQNCTANKPPAQNS
jgi:hypothetical protein